MKLAKPTLDISLKGIFKREVMVYGIFLVVQWLRLHTSTAGDAGSIPVKGNKILHAACVVAKKKREIMHIYSQYTQVQFSHSVVSKLCEPMNRSTPGLPVHQQLPEFTQTHVHRVSDAIQPSHPLSSPSPPAPSVA